MDFHWSGTFVGLDDVVVDGASLAGNAAPVPSLSAPATAALASLLLAAAAGLRRTALRTRR